MTRTQNSFEVSLKQERLSQVGDYSYDVFAIAEGTASTMASGVFKIVTPAAEPVVLASAQPHQVQDEVCK